MAFCTKCGDEVNKDWKHCPSCGQVVTKSTLSTKKSDVSPKSTFIAKDAKPAVNGIPAKSTKKVIPQDEALKLDESNSNKNFEKFVAVFVSLILGMVLIIGISSYNSASAERALKESKIQEKKKEEEQAQAAIFQADKVSFVDSLLAFKNSNCKPKFSKGETWAMELDGVEGIGEFSTNYGFNPDRKIQWESMGNAVDRTLVVIASYQLKLGDLYWDIFDIYKEMNEMGGYRSKWNQNFVFLDKMAKKLCYQDEPSPQQLIFAEESLLAISDWRFGFQSWYTEAKESSTRISQEYADYYEEMTTPKCTETKTNIPGYNIVKCTNLP
jgi:hypothetical protein